MRLRSEEVMQQWIPEREVRQEGVGEDQPGSSGVCDQCDGVDVCVWVGYEGNFILLRMGSVKAANMREELETYLLTVNRPRNRFI
jgi:hypothetical protein